MVTEIVAAMDAFEADESVGAVVVTGTPPAFCAGANLGNLATADGVEPRQRLRGVPAHRPQPAADARRRQRRRRRRRDEPGPRLRRAARRPAGPVRHPVPADRHPPRRRAHVDVPAHRRAAGDDGRRACSARCSTAPRPSGSGSSTAASTTTPCSTRPTRWRPGRRRRRASWRSVTKATIQAMADIDDHPAAVARELEPQLWSTRQPWFAERIAALQAKISEASRADARRASRVGRHGEELTPPDTALSQRNEEVADEPATPHRRRSAAAEGRAAGPGPQRAAPDPRRAAGRGQPGERRARPGRRARARRGVEAGRTTRIPRSPRRRSPSAPAPSATGS